MATKVYELIAPCHFGLEAVLKKEILDLGYEIARVEDGKVTFYGDAEAICRANIFLRTTERILLKVGSFRAVTFEELFQGTKALPWEDFIPLDGKFWVKKANSIKRLNSLLLMELAFFTQNFPSRGINSSHGKAFVP